MDGRDRFMPFSLSVSVAAADQFTKFLILRSIAPYRQTGQVVPVIGDFVSFIRTQNLGIAFSIGHNWPELVRRILFVAIPLIVVVTAAVYIVRDRDLTPLQRWAIAGLIGGGLGNMVDRIIRPEGVVDFVLVNMYGFLGQRYFPVFNLADSAVTVCGILLIAALVFQHNSRTRKAAGDDL